MVEMTNRPQRAILEGMRNWKVWVSALIMVVALGCGVSSNEPGLTSAEIDDIYDICGTKKSELRPDDLFEGPRKNRNCIQAARVLIDALEQGGDCDFRGIVYRLHTGDKQLDGFISSLSSIRDKYCPIPLIPVPDSRPLFQQIEEWLGEGAGTKLILLVTVVVVGGTLLRERWQKKHPPRGQ
jgi:hypothetical protein